MMDYLFYDSMDSWKCEWMPAWVQVHTRKKKFIIASFVRTFPRETIKV